MRELLLPVAFLALGLAACGALTGLGAYSEGSPDAAVNVSPQGGSSGGERDDGASSGAPSGDGTTGNDDATDALASDDGGDDGGSGDDETEGGTSADAGGAADAASGHPDAGSYDAAPDALPPCDEATCPGCCTSDGVCSAGQSSSSCGKGGATCMSCSGSTPTCSSAGACAAAPVEAGAPTCTASQCAMCGGLQVQCCTSSHTCGCEYFWPSTCQ